MKEIWKKIEGYSNYEVSNFGRVKSLGRWVEYEVRGIYSINKCRKKMPTKILKLSINGDGYKFVGMRGDDNQVKSCTVHRLVALAFLPGHNQVVHHKDNNKKNNHISNLEWTTRAENLRIHFREHYKPKKITL